MASNLIDFSEGTPVVWANSSDYSAAVSGLARTDQLDLTGVANGAARQGEKHDFGVTRDQTFLIAVALEFASDTVSGEQVPIYHAGSPSGTAGNANPGGTSGADDGYTGTAGDSLADSVAQLIPLGFFNTTSDNTPTVQYQIIGRISGDDMMRYGMPVVYDLSTGAFHSDAVEMYVAYIPINPDIEAAA